MHSVRFLFVLTFVLILVICGCGTSRHAAVTPTLSSMTVSATSLSPALGTTTQLSANGTFSDGSSQSLTTVAWSSSNTAVATVSASGVVTTKSQGTAIITGTVGTVTATTTITVGPPILSSLAISPTNPSRALGLTQTFTVTGTMTDGSAAGTMALTWTSSNTAVATVVNGLVTTKSTGTTTITVSVGSITISTTLSVTPAAISSIAVTPANPSIAISTDQQFAATATYTDATTKDVTATATWHSSTPATATMDATVAGLAHGIAAGGSQISATQDGVTGVTDLTVTGASNAVSFLYATAFDQTKQSYVLKTFGVATDGTMQEINSQNVDSVTGRMVTDGTRFLYIDSGSAGGITGYTMNLNTGALTPLPSYTPPQGTSVERIALDPTSKRMYGFDGLSAVPAIKILDINQTTGALTDSGLSYPLAAGVVLPNSGHNNALFVTNQNGTFFYFGGGGGLCATYGGSGPCKQLNGYTVDTVTGALTAMPGSPFDSWSPQVWSMATSSDQSILWLSLDAYRIASYSLDPVTGIPSVFDHWFPLGQGLPIPAMVPQADHFYAGQNTKLLWIHPDPTTKVLGGSVWSYNNGNYVTDLALNSPYSQLFTSDSGGVSSFSLDNVGQPTFVTRAAFPGAEHVIVVSKPN